MNTSFTIQTLLESACNRLQQSGTARLDAEILLSTVLNTGREYLYSHPDDTLESEVVIDFNSLVNKRSQGFPVAYLTGIKEFWSIQFIVNRNTLIPRPETELLVETALNLIPGKQQLDILDLGTGCGAIAIALARERPDVTVTATDISRDTLATAAENAGRLGIDNIRFKHSDWFSDLGKQYFHIILCNPPYVESGNRGFVDAEIRYEPRLALDGGHHGLQAYNRIIPAALRYLSANGCLLLEHGAGQGEQIRRIFKENHYYGIQTIRDLSGHERVSFGYIP